MHPNYVIKKPLLTEKTTNQMNELGHYAFEVDRSATKDDIREAVEAIYGVNVEAVRTQTRKGKVRRYRYGYVHKPPTKKALVRIKEGQVIELF
ncbi:MAG: 50S ribosomal protein L23 [Planctomycetota bacterium]